MTLAAHSVVGATVVKVLPFNPFLAIFLAFMSHFVLDAIPHWDYPLKSAVKTTGDVAGVKFLKGRLFWRDLTIIAFDLLLGLSLIWFLYTPDFGLWFWLLLGVGAAVLPDFLQFAYGKYGGSVLTFFQSWHNYCHSKFSLNNYFWPGVILQILTVGLIIFLINWVFVL